MARERKIRAVLDTNVLIGLAGRPLLILARINKFQTLVSDVVYIRQSAWRHRRCRDILDVCERSRWQQPLFNPPIVKSA